MYARRFPVILTRIVVTVLLCACVESAWAKSEIKGAAILDTPCGKVAVKQMGLLHAGKIDAANKLTTREMQEKWKAMPPTDRAMMTGLARMMSQTEEQFTAAIRANGVLVVDGHAAKLTVKTTTKDANGSSTRTLEQDYRINEGECLISR